MIVGHSLPTPTWAVSSSSLSGAAILSPSSALSDRRPDTPTRMQWMMGTPVSTHKFYLRAEFLPAFVPGLIGVLNPSLPADLLVTAAFRRSSDTPGTYPYTPTMYQPGGQRIVEGPRGEKTCWLMVAPGADPVVGVQIEFWNNVDGHVAVASEAKFTVGEVVICPTMDVEIDRRWTLTTIDPTTTQYDPWRQPVVQPGTPYRRLTFQLPPEDIDDVFGSATDARERLLAKIDRGQSCVYIPRTEVDGVFNTAMMHRTAMLGVATDLPAFTHEAGPMFTSSRFTVNESPIPT